MKKKLVILTIALGILSACSNKEPKEEKEKSHQLKVLNTKNFQIGYYSLNTQKE